MVVERKWLLAMKDLVRGVGSGGAYQDFTIQAQQNGAVKHRDIYQSRLATYYQVITILAEEE